MEISETDLQRLRESSGLSLDAEGRFFVRGEPVEHERTHLVLTQGLHRAADGRWATRIGREWAYVEVQDVARFVRRIEPLLDDAQPGRLIAWLTSGEEQIVQARNFSGGTGDALYVQLPDGEKARLSRAAQLSLSEYLREDEHGVGIELQGVRYEIPHAG